MLKDSMVGMQNFIEDLKLRCVDIENGYKKKMDYLQKDLQEYQKREDMFAREIERLNQEIAEFYRK
jgi:cell division protein FtsB